VTSGVLSIIIQILPSEESVGHEPERLAGKTGLRLFVAEFVGDFASQGDPTFRAGLDEHELRPKGRGAVVAELFADERYEFCDELGIFVEIHRVGLI